MESIERMSWRIWKEVFVSYWTNHKTSDLMRTSVGTELRFGAAVGASISSVGSK